MRAVFGGGVRPLQPVFDDIDDPAQNLAVIGSADAPFFGKERRYPLNLLT